MTVATPPAVAQVYELLNGSTSMLGAGTRHGLFTSIDGAKAHAATIHRDYLDQQQSMTPDEREDVEHVHPGELEWSRGQRHLPGRPDVPLGDPVPMARYSASSYFVIEARPLHA